MDSNRDDAERCLQLAAAALEAGNSSKATRLLEKSCRMYPLPEQQARLEAALRLHSASTSTKPPLPKDTPAESPRPEDADSTTPRAPTEAMVSAVRAVRKVANKSHYEVLAVPRDADEAALKRSYRKLALRLHPDRNQAPGADEAFKRVSTAFVTLSDPQRRAHYDQFGTDDPSQPPLRSQGARRRRGRASTVPTSFDDFVYMQNDLSGEDLFEFLFRAAAANQDLRAAREEPEHVQPSAPLTFWERFKPMILMFTMIIMAMFLSKDASPADFSLNRTAYHTVKRATRNDVTYFTSRGLRFDNVRAQRRLEERVDFAAYEDFSDKCNRELGQENYLLGQSKRWTLRRKDRAKFREMYDNFRKPWCDKTMRLRDLLQRQGY